MKLFWKLQFSKRFKVILPHDKRKKLVLEFKVVDGVQYILKDYFIYKKVRYFQEDLFATLRPTLLKNVFTPNPLFEALR